MANTIAKAIKKYVNQLRLNTISPDKDTISNQNQETKEEEKTIKPIKKNTVVFKVQIASGKKRFKQHHIILRDCKM